MQTISLSDSAKDSDPVADYVIKTLETYEHANLCKFIGAGVPTELVKRAPKLCSRLWLGLDIIPITILPEVEGEGKNGFWVKKNVDEQADSMARKCIMYVKSPISFPWLSAILLTNANHLTGTSVPVLFPSYKLAIEALLRSTLHDGLASWVSRISSDHVKRPLGML